MHRTAGPSPSGRGSAARCTDRQVGRRAPARAARRLGAGGRAPRRSELPTQRRLLGALPRPTSAASDDPASDRDAPAVYGPLMHDPPCATRCSTISIRSNTTRSPRRAAPLAIIAPGRLRQDPRAHAPHRVRRPRGPPRARHVLAVTFTRKAAGELVVPHRSTRRRRPHHRGHVPRDRARPAAPPRDRAQSRGAAGARAQGAPARAAHGRPRARRRRSRWPTSRPRSSGPRPASSRPTATRPPPRPPGGAAPRARARCPGCTRNTRPRSASGTSSTSTTFSAGAQTPSRDDEEFAAGQRWRFRHLFVDEFQDATPLAAPAPARVARRLERSDGRR